MPKPLSLSERKCLWCKSLITGRSDKKFCKNSCKSHYKRATPSSSEILPELPPLSAHATIIAQALFAYDPDHVLMLPYEEEEVDENNNVIEGSIIKVPSNESYEYYLKVRRYQEETDSLHTPYADVIEAYLDNIYDQPGIKLLDSHIERLAEIINIYVRHPGLDIPGHIAHYRLSNLYLIYHHVQSQRRYYVSLIAKGEIPYLLGVGGYLLDRHKTYLWGNLLGVE